MNDNLTIPESGNKALVNMHQLLLEALRHREQEIIRYLAILGPTIGGFILLLNLKPTDKVFIAGTIGVQFLLLLGCIYSNALGYNYRYIIFELAKLEAALGITKFMLKSWPRSLDDFKKRYDHNFPLCIPPEIIMVFWISFLIGIEAVTITAYDAARNTSAGYLFMLIGNISFLLGLFVPYYYGRKLKKSVKNELKPKEEKESDQFYGFTF